MKGFLIGFGVGVTVGLLFAPMKGEDVRVMAGVRASEIADTARETYDQVKSTVGKAAGAVRTEATNPSTGSGG